MNTAEFIIFENNIIKCQGAWTLPNLVNLQTALKKITLKNTALITINGNELTELDSSGAWELQRLINQLEQQQIKYELINFQDKHLFLLKMLADQMANLTKIPHSPPHNWLYRLGKRTVDQLALINAFLAFIGEIAIVGLNLLKRPTKIRWHPLLAVIETTGYQAMPIIALLSFMIGVVLTYQMGLQLRTYGANIFIVDLLGFSVFREFGPLLTAIIVIGRTGSAFTAQLGTMVLNEEVNALRTMGIAPAEILVLPKIIGLLIVMPLLAIWANIFGVIGGMIMANSMLDITVYDFFDRFSQVVSIRSLFVGLAKTPIYALLIASIGCFQGMRVTGGADSVGRHTTRSVVQAIFCLIIADALFSILFSKLGI